MSRRKQLVGEVITDAMDKTVVVRVTRLAEHPLYKKKIKRVSKFAVHDEQNGCRVGDQVLIEETRPLSKTKRWRVVTVLKKAAVLGGDESDSTENYA
ncbi:MAG: small subunit ribosomal protein [Candidatus Atribacteria bacterium]|nr:small subunit ribosomal protein [Candidatus Atribacteria bacterium]